MALRPYNILGAPEDATDVLGTLQGYTATATAAGTTTLTDASTALQVFTGTTTQTVVLPVTSTIVVGVQYTIANKSTGAVTVNASDASLVATVAASSTARVSCNSVAGTTNAAWTVLPTAAGGGSVAGSNTQIQFNDAGAFGGDADLTWNKTTNTLGLGGADTGIDLLAATNAPSTPAANTLHLYARIVAGRTVLKTKASLGLSTPLQNAFWQNNIVMWSCASTTTGLWIGTVGIGAGTSTVVLPTAGGNLYATVRRNSWANVVTTADQILGQRGTEIMHFRGSVAGQGGFFFWARQGFETWTNGGRFFSGMHRSTAVITANPSAHNNCIGFAVDTTDNGLIYFMTRDATTTTRVSTGFTITSGAGYDTFMWCAANDTQVGWRIVDINTGAEASGTATTNLPVNTATMCPGVLASNAALTTAAAIVLSVNRIYVETDY